MNGRAPTPTERIARLEAAQAAEQEELQRLEARQRLSRMLRQAHAAASAESVEAGNSMARVLDDGRVADVIELRPALRKPLACPQVTGCGWRMPWRTTVLELSHIAPRINEAEAERSSADASWSHRVKCLSRDLVRLHGAIVAALEIYPVSEAVGLVLEPAVADLQG